MKKLFLLIITMLFLVSCTSKTEFGNCIGIGEDKEPNLIYKVNTKNIVIGVVFFEMILPPIFVLADETLCPIGYKGDKK